MKDEHCKGAVSFCSRIPVEDSVLLECDVVSDNGCPVFQKIVTLSSRLNSARSLLLS
jgi:hypothetical protein